MPEWCSLLRTEATVVLWAIQLAMSENWEQIIIKEDGKSCFDSLTMAEILPD